MKDKIILFIFICFSYSGLSQNLELKGKIINSKSGKPIEFANIGVVNSFVGAATDFNGEFSFEIYNKMLKNQVKISAIGYKPKIFTVNELIENKSIIIKLEPTTYDISEVNIEKESKLAYGILKVAANNISNNYLDYPYGYNCYLYSKYKNISNEYINESIVLLTDSCGYVNRSFLNAFDARNYIIKQSNPNKPPITFEQGLSVMDKLINLDVVRVIGNVLNTSVINDFSISIKDNIIFDGDSSWVISYKCKNPNMSNAGDPNLSSYNGEIIINKNNYAVLKNSIQAQREGVFIHGNSFVSNSKDKISYNAEVCYKKYKNNKYRLYTIDYLEKNHSNKSECKTFLNVLNVTHKAIDNLTSERFYKTNLKSRQYFNNTNYDKDFWNSFSLDKYIKEPIH